jgi:hypothetical protein
MKGLYKSLAITGCAALARAAVFVALLLQPSQNAYDMRADGGVLFTSAEPTEISSVSVINAAGSYRFYYEGDGYVLDDIPADIADLDAFIGFMVNCGNLSAVRRVTTINNEEYGIDKPAATVEITFFDGRTLRLAIGAREPISGDYYVTAEGYPGVYLMSEPIAIFFLRPKTQVIDMRVTPVLAVSSPLSAIRDITFAGGSLAQPVTMSAVSGGNEQVRLAALSFGASTHIMRNANVYPLDQTYGEKIFSSLFGIEALDIKGYNLSKAELEAMGFEAPWMTIEFDAVNGADAMTDHYYMRLISDGNDAFLINVNGGGAVFRIGRRPFMDILYEKLPARWFLSPMLKDLSAIEIEGENLRYRFEIDNADPKNPIITSEGGVLDTQVFRSFFRLLTSAAHDGAYLGGLERPMSGELLTIIYEYLAPGKAPDVLALYPGGARRVNVFVNGMGEFAMKDQFVARALEGCRNLIAGQPIEENW